MSTKLDLLLPLGAPGVGGAPAGRSDGRPEPTWRTVAGIICPVLFIAIRLPRLVPLGIRSRRITKDIAR